MKTRGLHFAPGAFILVTQGAIGTPLGTPLGPDLNILWFLVDLGFPWKPLLGQIGHNFVILDMKIGVGIRSLFPNGFCKEM